MSKTIFITGASRGFGKIWAEAFLDRGDKVVVTSRNLSSLKDLAEKYESAVLTLELDITDREACFAAIAKANVHFGSIDVVINNAGTGVVGTIEELSEKEARDIIDANLFGTLWITQAVLPILRAQGSGHILQLSSALGIYAFPTVGIYSASKFAVEGLSEALAQEVKGLGIHITIVEPNGYATDFNNSSVKSISIPAYDSMKAELYANPEFKAADAYGDPQATSEAILLLVDSPNPPLRLILGKKALPLAKYIYAEKLTSWETWKDVSVKAHGL
ncbi:NADP-dependent 3-hydroxy acid dehydrogenase YdfG [Mucilaginibacter mallensis]|uniref:NADP-dependent 3-hydroxy acid dehydrogenase YdfG n=1 Tax=Mucilaginibacter mallensis TaxID=652787 RepID=A0A1H2CFI3_MUCMA|nr:SDR family NAD(P)-dependent oxidoreductase [Mucilaginibacter mallensis]SDT69079.1 NADP-dependent 3-hydroxy acid dehydrogenase YdfG [Mucilaginibacter mallensis]